MVRVNTVKYILQTLKKCWSHSAYRKFMILLLFSLSYLSDTVTKYLKRANLCLPQDVRLRSKVRWFVHFELKSRQTILVRYWVKEIKRQKQWLLSQIQVGPTFCVFCVLPIVHSTMNPSVNWSVNEVRFVFSSSTISWHLGVTSEG